MRSNCVTLCLCVTLLLLAKRGEIEHKCGTTQIGQGGRRAAGGSKIEFLNPAIVSNTHSMVGGGDIMREIKDSEADKR